MAETLAHYRHYGIPTERAMPRVFVAFRVKLRRVLDITQGDVRRVLQVSAQRMTDEPWRHLQDRGKESLTQALGRSAWKLGLTGMLVPSAADRYGTNLLIFPDNLQKTDGVAIVNPADFDVIKPASQRRQRGEQAAP